MTTVPVSPSVAYGAWSFPPAGTGPALGGGALGTVFTTTSGVSHKAESIAGRLDALSAHHMVRNAIAEFASTARREFIKDAKDLVKDPGEAGHRP
jgi:hypothetical protein